MKKYILNNLIALDQLCNALLGGDPDETISARAWRCKDDKIWKYMRIFIDKLFFWEKDHCQSSYIAECKRKHLNMHYH